MKTAAVANVDVGGGEGRKSAGVRRQGDSTCLWEATTGGRSRVRILVGW